MAASAETNRPPVAKGEQFATPSLRQTTSRGLGILRIIARHGFAGAIRGRGHWPHHSQVRTALEELGVVYLKFGQVLALQLPGRSGESLRVAGAFAQEWRKPSASS